MSGPATVPTVAKPIEPMPPANLEAEEYVLGACMLSARAIDAVTEIVTRRDFYRASHGIIFDAIVELYGEGAPVDPITVAEKLAGQGDVLERMGGRDRIREIATLVPAAGNASHHAKIVRENAVWREVILLGSEAQRLGHERELTGVEIIEELERRIFDLSQVRRSGDFITSREAGREAFDRIQMLAQAGHDVVGLASGFNAIDRMTSGFHPGNMIVVAGRPSMGKTALALCMAANIVIRGNPPMGVALFTLEMGRNEVMNRLYASDGLVPSDHLMTPRRLDSEDWSRLTAAQARFHDAPFFIDDSGAVTMTEVRSKARRLKLKNPDLGLIIVDYLQLMSSGARVESRQNEISQISRSMKLLAVELQLPVIVISQLSRDVEKRHDRRPILSDLRESGAIEQDSDVVMLVYREEYYFPEDEEHQGIAEVNIAKHRNGPTGMRKLSFVSRFAKFSDLPDGYGAPEV